MHELSGDVIDININIETSSTSISNDVIEAVTCYVCVCFCVSCPSIPLCSLEIPFNNLIKMFIFVIIKCLSSKATTTPRNATQYN